MTKDHAEEFVPPEEASVKETTARTTGCSVVKTIQRWHVQDGTFARDIWYEW